MQIAMCRLSQKGELSTLLMILAGAVMLLGVGAGTKLAQNSTDVSSLAASCSDGLSKVWIEGVSGNIIPQNATVSCFVESNTDKTNLCAFSINNNWPVNCPWKVGNQTRLANGNWKIGFTCSLSGSGAKSGDTITIRAMKAVSDCVSTGWLKTDITDGNTYSYISASGQPPPNQPTPTTPPLQQQPPPQQPPPQQPPPGGNPPSGCSTGDWICTVDGNTACANASVQSLFNQTWCEGEREWKYEAAFNSTRCYGYPSSPRPNDVPYPTPCADTLPGAETISGTITINNPGNRLITNIAICFEDKAGNREPMCDGQVYPDLASLSGNRLPFTISRWLNTSPLKKGDKIAMHASLRIQTPDNIANYFDDPDVYTVNVSSNVSSLAEMDVWTRIRNYGKEAVAPTSNVNFTINIPPLPTGTPVQQQNPPPNNPPPQNPPPANPPSTSLDCKLQGSGSDRGCVCKNPNSNQYEWKRHCGDLPDADCLRECGGSSGGGSYVPPPTNLASDRFNPKVYIVVYDPILKSGNKLHVERGYNDPYDLANQFASTINESSYGMVTYSIVGQRELNMWGEIPIKRGGFQYNEETHAECLRTQFSNSPTCYSPDVVDFKTSIVDKLDLCSLVNSQGLDEIWLFGAPWFGFYEAVMAGPGAFNTNGSPVTGTSCNRTIHIMGFNYERGLSEMLEDFSHRVEGVMIHTIADGHWAQNETNEWNQFSLVAPSKSGFPYSHCGNAHFPPNTSGEYFYNDYTPVSSYCNDWLSYPNRSNQLQTDLDCRLEKGGWGCGHAQYLTWWLKHIPHADGVGKNGFYNNWWRYFISTPPQLAKGNTGPDVIITGSTNEKYYEAITRWRGGELNVIDMSAFINQLTRYPGLQQLTCDPFLPSADPASCQFLPSL